MNCAKTLILLFLLCIFAVGCDSKYEDSTAGLEQERTEKNQKRLLKNQPPVSLDYSLERANINKRTELWNDENKLSYIYLVSYGKVMAFYIVKGKVSSVNSQITNPNQVIHKSRARMAEWSSHVIASPAEDGSYGSNGDAIFFFTADNTYVEWAGEYMLADKPLKLSTPPQLIRKVGK